MGTQNADGSLLAGTRTPGNERISPEAVIHLLEKEQAETRPAPGELLKTRAQPRL